MATKKAKPAEKDNGASAIVMETNVKITVMKKGLKVKTIKINNKATQLLFWGLANFLRKGWAEGSNRDSMLSHIPSFLALGFSDSPGITFNQSELNEERVGLSRFSLLSNGPIVTKNSVSVVFTCLVGGDKVGDKPITEIGLFATSTGNTLLAYLPVLKEGSSAEYGLTLEQDYSWFVEWALTFQNKNV